MSHNKVSHVKHILPKTAQGIEAIYTLRKLPPLHFKISILNTLGLSHIHYSAVLLSTISNNLIITLEKNSRVVKFSFHCTKYSSTVQIKKKNHILPIEFLLVDRLATYVKVLIMKKKRVFLTGSGLQITAAIYYIKRRTNTWFSKNFLAKNSPRCHWIIVL